MATTGVESDDDGYNAFLAFLQSDESDSVPSETISKKVEPQPQQNTNLNIVEDKEPQEKAPPQNAQEETEIDQPEEEKGSRVEDDDDDAGFNEFLAFLSSADDDVKESIPEDSSSEALPPPIPVVIEEKEEATNEKSNQVNGTHSQEPTLVASKEEDARHDIEKSENGNELPPVVSEDEDAHENISDNEEYEQLRNLLSSSKAMLDQMMAEDPEAKKEMHKFVQLELGMLFSLAGTDETGGADVSKIWVLLKEDMHWKS